MRNFFRLPKKPAGETLLETIVAITVLSMILVSVFSLLTQALSANQDIKNRVIALSHAREGIEGVRNIRDTNWLRFSGDRRGKWLCKDDACSNSLSGTSYHFLNYSAPNYTLDDGNSDAMNAAHQITGTDFYRQITLNVESTNKCSSTPHNDCNEDRLYVKSLVSWLESGLERKVTLETYLYDFYGRNSY